MSAAMPRRHVTDERDLPDHDLILECGGQDVYHVRHYVHRDAHMVLVGRLEGGASPTSDAARLAAELVERVVPAGREFTLVAYAPQDPLSGEPHFREVAFAAAGRVRRPSAAALADPRTGRALTRPLDLAAVEALAGRPVLIFPYGFYTRRLAEAMNGQPAKRLLELMIEARLVCPTHGPSRYGEYCGAEPRCEYERRVRARVWRTPYSPRRSASPGAYRGRAAARAATIELHTEVCARRVPVFSLDAPTVAWGHDASGADEAATAILADYLGFLPRPELRERFRTEVIARLPAEAFTLPIAQLDEWFERANGGLRRGLVVLAGPAGLGWVGGYADEMASRLAHELLTAGFDVYEPKRNGEIAARDRADDRLHGMLHTSLLGALRRCSMIVVPYDGEAFTQDVESVTALRYALEHPDVPALIAYDRARPGDFERHNMLGVVAMRVKARVGLSPDVEAAMAAVDEACAAYECLHEPLGV